MNGQSQAVRLPKEYRFKSTVVYIRRNVKGEVILSEKPRTWEDYFNETVNQR
ncbi:antitoxin [Acinetobacter sp. CAAS 2-6]|uniref:antitoxin n=1 Tax=Acinetobacter sp. CAAS 2-6 TaxID=3016358 RepID=UPI003FA350A9